MAIYVCFSNFMSVIDFEFVCDLQITIWPLLIVFTITIHLTYRLFTTTPYLTADIFMPPGVRQPHPTSNATRPHFFAHLFFATKRLSSHSFRGHYTVFPALGSNLVFRSLPTEYSENIHATLRRLLLRVCEVIRRSYCQLIHRLPSSCSSL